MIDSSIPDADIRSSSLFSEDLAPVPLQKRTWGTWNYIALWIGMSLCIPTYMLASSLIDGGMNWWQAILTIFLGNTIVLIPMILNGHAGAKYGIPFPVFARASFGVRGANIPAMLRAIVACGWFGIQTWIGGYALYQMFRVWAPSLDNLPAVFPPSFGLQTGPAITFFLFWLLMTLFAFIGVVVTSSTAIIYGNTIWDPLVLAGRFDDRLMVTVAMVAVTISTLATNIAANMVSPANDFANLSPRRISFRAGGYITGIIGILIFPWKLIASPSGYIFTWLIAYSSLLGPIGGIMISDYYFIRKQVLNVTELYDPYSRYRYSNGFNRIAVVALLLGILPNVPGFLTTVGALDKEAVWPWVAGIYHYAWFVGFFVSGMTYYLMMGVRKRNEAAQRASLDATVPHVNVEQNVIYSDK